MPAVKPNPQCNGIRRWVGSLGCDKLLRVGPSQMRLVSLGKRTPLLPQPWEGRVNPAAYEMGSHQTLNLCGH